MGPERLDRAKTVESIAAVTASSRALRASVGLVRYPPRAAGLAAGAAVCLLGAPAGGHGELLFPTVDAAGRSVGVGWRNRPCVAGIGIVPAGGHPRLDGSPTRLAANGPPIAGRPGRARRRSRYRGTAPPWFQLPWPRSPCLPLPAVDLGTPPAMSPSPLRRSSASPP